MITALVPVDEVIVFVVVVLVMPKSVPTFFCAPSSISSSLFLSAADKKPAALCVAVLCVCVVGAFPSNSPCNPSTSLISCSCDVGAFPSNSPCNPSTSLISCECDVSAFPLNAVSNPVILAIGKSGI